MVHDVCTANTWLNGATLMTHILPSEWVESHFVIVAVIGFFVYSSIKFTFKVNWSLARLDSTYHLLGVP